MIKHILPVLILSAIFAAVGCAEPAKYSPKKAPICNKSYAKLKGVPYTPGGGCTAAIAPFDVGIWYESPMNSHMTRGVKTAQIGCKPPVAGEAACVDCRTTIGHSNTLMANFDPTIFNDDVTVGRAVLAVYSPDNPDGLYNVYLRGRLNVGGELVSLAKNRDGVASCDSKVDGWVFYDVTSFVARAIKERRNSVHFEMSLPCQPANLVTVGVAGNEPRLIVEYY